MESPTVVSLGYRQAARREFLHVDDLAEAAVFLTQHYSGEDIVNVGTGTDLSIHELAQKIAVAAGYTGELKFDSGKPDGTPRKLLDVGRDPCHWLA